LQKHSSETTMPECLLKTVLSGQRYRKSCYFDATVRCGLQSTAPYNHMLLPVVFSSVREEYENLKTNVCLWDVAVQRQIEVFGPDAFALVDILTPRGLTTMKVGECRYTIMTDEKARENFLKYGNPDGKGSMAVGIALPKFLQNQDY